MSWQTAAFPITGWETERGQGGANQIKGRERTPDRIAHSHCLEHHLNQAKRGVIAGQTEL